MRKIRFAVSFALLCAASPAVAQPRILTVEDQAQDQTQGQAKDQTQGPVQTPPQDQVKTPAPAEPLAQPQPAPAQAQEPAPPPGQNAAPAQGPAAPPAGEKAEMPVTAAPAREEPNQAPNPDSTPAKVPSRYGFQRVDGGFLRLDNTTGQMAFCSSRTVGWACQAVPEDRAALEKEIGRLQGEVGDLQDKIAALKVEIGRLREPPPASEPAMPPRPPADLAPPADKGGGLKMPSEEDLARARAAISDAWRRLMEMIATLQRELMRKVMPSDRTTI